MRGTSEARAIGVDVGGTKVAAGIVDLAHGSVGERTEISTRPDRGGREVLDDVVHLVAGLAGDDGATDAIGVAVCELVTPEGAITSAQTIDWRDFDVVAALA
ncbi:MAG TPA: ROK family protein, partial [Actinomycetota bacterium]